MRSPFAGFVGKRVRGTGPLAAKIVIVGEAPGGDEEREGVPFIGASGRFLWEHLARHGITREQVRVENVVEIRPPQNVLHHLTPGVIAKAQQSLWDRLAALEAPVVLVPVGNLALNTLRGNPLPVTATGKSAGKWKLTKTPDGQRIKWPDKISNWRGSIFKVFFPDGRGVKVIPTYHPAFVLRAASAWPTWEADWRRIAIDATFRGLRLNDPREVVLDPSENERNDFYAQCMSLWEEHNNPRPDVTDPMLAVDIETPGGTPACVGLAVDEDRALVVPVRRDTRPWLTRLMASPLRKTFHFGMFDTYMLARAHMPVAAWWWDSRDLHHLLDPLAVHKLAFCCSVDRRTAFWKDERMYGTDAADKGAYTKKAAGNFRALMEGCAKDVAHTWGLTMAYRARAEAEGLLPLYADQKRRLSWAARELGMTGMRVDRGRWAHYREECVAAMARQREVLRGLAGEDLIATKGLSRPRVAKYFYGTLKCAPFRKRGSLSLTTDEVHLRKLMLKYKKARPGAEAVLEYARYAKRLGWFGSKLTEDDRYLSQYALIPINARLASSTTPDGYGDNGQNVNRLLRDVFIPTREDWVVCKVDLSQAESRIVDGQSGDRRGIELAQTPPWELDQHRTMAAEVLDIAPEAVSEEERDVVGKRGRHAYNYGMEGFRMSEVLLLETESRIIRTPEECTEILDGIGRARPYISAWQAWVREQVLGGGLVNSWGTRLPYRHGAFRLSKEDFKQAYAWMASSEVALLLNLWGWLPLRRFLRREGLTCRIIQQEHDALAFEGTPEDCWAAACCLRETLMRPREYSGLGGPWTLAMPMGLKVGANLGKGDEWKQFPSKEAFMETARGCLR